MSDGRVLLVVRLNDESAFVWAVLQGSEPAAMIVGGVPVPPVSTKSSEV